MHVAGNFNVTNGTKNEAFILYKPYKYSPQAECMILVTGAAGFIGMHIAKRLLEEGHDVVGVDDVNDYYDPKLKEARIEQLNSPRFVFRRMDFADLTKADLRDVSHVFHEAAYAGVRSSVENPLLYEKVNTHDTVKLLKLCVDAGVEKFIFASSSSVYGNVSQFPTPETHPTNPVSPYGASKLAAEKYCYAFHECYGFPSIMLRYFTVYGPWGRPDMLVAKTIASCLGGKPIMLFKKGGKPVDFRRDFSYIGDIVEANMLAMKSSGRHDVFNVSEEHDASVDYVIELIYSHISRKPAYAEAEANPADPLRTLGDIAKIKKTLGFRPRTSIEDGIAKTVEWYREYYQK